MTVNAKPNVAALPATIAKVEHASRLMKAVGAAVGIESNFS
jgi:hypothetical protein